MPRFQDIVTDNEGNGLPGAIVTVRDYPSGNLSTLTADSGGSLTNPIVADANGAYYFNAANAIYSLEFRLLAYEPAREVRLVNLGNLVDSVTLAAPTGAGLVGFAAGVTYDPNTIGAVLLPPGTATADVALTAGQLVNLYVTGGVTHMQLADGSVTTKPAHAFCPLSVNVGATGYWQRRGIIPGTASTAFSAMLWLSDSVPGSYQTTGPTTTGHISQVVGMVLPGIGIEFNPQVETGL